MNSDEFDSTVFDQAFEPFSWEIPRESDLRHSAPKTSGPPDTSSLRIAKKFSPADRGALKLSQRFGDALVCVRHRIDPKGEYRYTTVELLVEKVEIRKRTSQMVGVRIAAHKRPLQMMVRTAGAKWDPPAKLWRMPRRLAEVLKLADRIAKE
jgi:hypothetical protein